MGVERLRKLHTWQAVPGWGMVPIDSSKDKVLLRSSEGMEGQPHIFVCK